MKLRRLTLAGAVATLALPLVTSCGTAPGQDRTVRVAAAFYPLAWVAEQVAGPDAEVTNLTVPGGEPHDLELTVNETLDVAHADLVVYEHGFQPAVDDVIGNVAEGELLDAASVVPMQLGPNGEVDPHFWLDPMRMDTLAQVVADRLGQIDPDHARSYRARADRLSAQLHLTHFGYVNALSNCARDTIVVSHDAFGYLSRYGLRIESITGLSPDAEPSPADLARLHDLVQRLGITTVFTERLASPRLAETLAHEAGVRTGVLDPIEGPATDGVGAGDYLQLMHANLFALTEANGC